MKYLIHQPPEYTPTAPVTSPVPDPAMNAVGNSNYEMLILIQKIQQQMTALVNIPPPNSYYPPQNRVRNKHSNVSKYYCSHRACAHFGRDFTRKIQVHKDVAMFENKIGGSTY